MLNSFGLLFFWHKRNGGGGWSVAFFCLRVRAAFYFFLLPIKSIISNEKNKVLQKGWLTKNVTEKKQQKGWRAEQQTKNWGALAFLAAVGMFVTST